MSDLEAERDGEIARIWLNRATVLNALSASLQEELIAMMAALAADPQISVIIIGGRGRAFTAGSDRAEIATLAQSRANLEQGFEWGERMVRALLESRLTVIVAVHGYCVGGGVSLTLAADVCLAAVDATFFIPELALGMPYLWQSTPLLLAAIGASRARALIMTGERFDAAEAKQMGIVHRVVPTDDLDDEALRLARSLAARPRFAREAQKRLATQAIDRILVDEGEFVASVLASE